MLCAEDTVRQEFPNFVVDVGPLRIALDNRSTRDLRYSQLVANSTVAQVWPEWVNKTYKRVVKRFVFSSHAALCWARVKVLCASCDLLLGEFHFNSCVAAASALLDV